MIMQHLKAVGRMSTLVPIILFAQAGNIWWTEGLILSAGSLVGGHFSAKLSSHEKAHTWVFPHPGNRDSSRALPYEHAVSFFEGSSGVPRVQEFGKYEEFKNSAVLRYLTTTFLTRALLHSLLYTRGRGAFLRNPAAASPERTWGSQQDLFGPLARIVLAQPVSVSWALFFDKERRSNTTPAKTNAAMVRSDAFTVTAATNPPINPDKASAKTCNA